MRIETIVKVQTTPRRLHQSDSGWLYGTTDFGSVVQVGGYDQTGTGYRFKIGQKVKNLLADKLNGLGEPMESWVAV